MVQRFYFSCKGVFMSKLNRNDPCLCGSGKKYKKCCERKDQERRKKKFEGVRGLRIDPLIQNKSPIRSLANHVFKVITEPLEDKPKKGEATQEKEAANVLPGEKPKTYGSLEELIGIEGET